MKSRETQNFSKEHSKPERKQVADAIRGERKKYFERHESIRVRTTKVEKQIENKEIDLEFLVNEIAQLEESVRKISNGRIAKFLNKQEIASIEQRLGVRNKDTRKAEEDLMEIIAILTQLEAQRANRIELGRAREMLLEFYTNESEKYKEYKEGLEARQVSSIMNNYEVAVVHALHPTFTPGENTLMREGASLEDKLRVLLATQPTISASTFGSQDSHDNLWASVGVILRAGEVLNADSSDLGTKATSIDGRGSTAPLFGKGNIRERITKAVAGPKIKYNELVVDNPDVAGMFICLDPFQEYSNQEEARSIDHREFKRISNSLSLPVYALLGGEIYEAIFNEKTKRYDVGPKVSLKEIQNSDFSIDEEMRLSMQEEILEHTPFSYEKLGLEEIFETQAAENGRRIYFEAMLFGKKDFKEGQVIREVPGSSLSCKYVFRNGEVVRISQYHEMKGYRSEDEDFLDQLDFTKGHIYYGRNFALKLEGDKFLSPGDLLRGLIGAYERKEREFAEEIEAQAIDSKRQKAREHYNKHLKRILFFIYGFGEEAGNNGDIAIQQEIWSFVAEHLPLSECAEVIKKRLKPDGRIRLTKEDLGMVAA